MAHIHRAIYREWGLLTVEERTIKNKEISYLMASQKISHHPLPQTSKPDTPIARGNTVADRVAKRAALPTTSSTLVFSLPDSGSTCLPEKPKCTQEGIDWIENLPTVQCINDWYRSLDCKIILPEKLGSAIPHKMHNTTHMGTQKIQDLMRHAQIKIRDACSKIE